MRVFPVPVSCWLAAKLFAPDTFALLLLTLNLLGLIYGIAIGFFEMLPNPTYRKPN
jgi:hypothetical protein